MNTLIKVAEGWCLFKSDPSTEFHLHHLSCREFSFYYNNINRNNMCLDCREPVPTDILIKARLLGFSF